MPYYKELELGIELRHYEQIDQAHIKDSLQKKRPLQSSSLSVQLDALAKWNGAIFLLLRL
jgi:hypothetical protein